MPHLKSILLTIYLHNRVRSTTCSISCTVLHVLNRNESIARNDSISTKDIICHDTLQYNDINQGTPYFYRTHFTSTDQITNLSCSILETNLLYRVPMSSNAPTIVTNEGPHLGNQHPWSNPTAPFPSNIPARDSSGSRKRVASPRGTGRRVQFPQCMR